MGGQFSLDGFEEPQPLQVLKPAGRGPLTKARVELFFALRPDPAVASKVVALTADLAADHQLRGRMQVEELLHVTLCPLEVAPSAQVIEAAKAAAGLHEASGFDVTFDDVMSFGQGHLVLTGDSGLQSLRAFQQSLRQALRDARFPVPSYTPHMTLLYGDRAHLLPRQRLAGPVGWKVQDFVLLRSWIGESRHEELGRWPLRASTA